MILKTQRNKLKKLLKRGWHTLVLLELSKKGIVSKSGKPYEKTFISHVFHGRNSNEEIENAIFSVAEQEKQKLTKMRVKRDLMLE